MAPVLLVLGVSIRCVAQPFTPGLHEAAADIGSYQQHSSKYDRIVAFVDAHATSVLPSDSNNNSFEAHELEQPSSWPNSYDEEAEEGELFDEPHLLAYTPVAASAAGHVAAMAASAASTTAATTAEAHSWSYGSLENPKPWAYAWDEEAEGSFELADNRQAVQQTNAQRRAALHEARHAAMLTRRQRRANLHPQLGDLEHMQAWVGDEIKAPQQQQTRRSVPSLQYQQLLALVAGDSAHRQYRKPKAWHLTFDEECHGDAPETVLGSC